MYREIQQASGFQGYYGRQDRAHAAMLCSKTVARYYVKRQPQSLQIIMLPAFTAIANLNRRARLD